MLVRPVSDLHIEFFNYNKIEKILLSIIPVLDTDSETVLTIAGDIGLFHRKHTFETPLQKLAQRFKAVVFVSGNHEYYNNRYWEKSSEYVKSLDLPKNVYYLNDDYVIIDDVVFMGGTLWTNYNNDPLAKWHCERSMNDFDCIRYEIDNTPYTEKSIRITPDDTVKQYDKTKQFIFENCDIFKDMKKVVITHHGCSNLSVHEKYKGDLLNAAFYSELGNEISYNNIVLWHHGHTHEQFDYMINDTRVVVNPYGYYNADVNKNFKKDMVIDI